MAALPAVRARFWNRFRQYKPATMKRDSISHVTESVTTRRIRDHFKRRPPELERLQEIFCSCHLFLRGPTLLRPPGPPVVFPAIFSGQMKENNSFGSGLLHRRSGLFRSSLGD